MKRWAIAIAVVAVLLVGAGAIGLPLVETQLARAIKSRIEVRPQSSVAGVDVGVLSRRIVLSDVTIGRLGDLTLKARRLEVSGLSWPLGDLLKGFTPFTGWRWGEPIYAERIEANDLYVVQNGEEFEWRSDKIVLEGVDLPRYTPLKDVPSDSLAQEALAFSMLSIRRVEQLGHGFSAARGEGAGFKIASLVIGGLDKGLLKSFTISGVELRERANRPPVSLGFAEIAGRGLDLSKPLESMKDPDWMLGMPTGRIWLDELAINGTGGEFLANHGISVGRISLATTRNATRATSLSKIEDFAIRPQGLTADALKMRLFLTTLGVREIKASFECSGIEDRAKGEFEIDRCVLVSPDLAEIEMTIKIVNGDQAFWRVMDEGDIYGLLNSSAGLGSIKVVARDKSLLDRLMGLYAASTRTTKPQARAALAREIRRFTPPDMLITEDMTKLADTIARFVEQGGTLTVEAKPDPPLTAEGARVLDRPGPDIISVLGITATLSK